MRPVVVSTVKGSRASGAVWRVVRAVEIPRRQGGSDQATCLAGKLGVERDALIRPGRLRELAVQFGLGPAKSGQIRWIGENGETLGETRAAETPQTRGTAQETEKAAPARAKAGQQAHKAAKPSRPGPDAQDAYEN